MISVPLRRLFVTLLALGAGTAGFAQPDPTRTGFEFTTRYAQTAASNLTGPGQSGTVQVDSWQTGLRATTPLSATTRLVYGLDWTVHNLDLTGAPGLPERLQAVAAPLGVMHQWDDNWRLLATLQPRLASAGRRLSSAGFDLPVLALASYTASPTLTWSFGLRYSQRSDVTLLPLLGAAWKFAPDWEFALAWPETGVSYRVSPQLTLRAVATFHGGDYQLAQDPRPPGNRPGASLADAWLEYREIRLGLAAEYALSRSVSLRADLGKVANQRFTYIDRGLELEGDNPTWFTVGVVGRF